jgi:hypothetical protein
MFHKAIMLLLNASFQEALGLVGSQILPQLQLFITFISFACAHNNPRNFTTQFSNEKPCDLPVNLWICYIRVPFLSIYKKKWEHVFFVLFLSNFFTCEMFITFLKLINYLHISSPVVAFQWMQVSYILVQLYNKGLFLLGLFFSLGYCDHSCTHGMLWIEQPNGKPLKWALFLVTRIGVLLEISWYWVENILGYQCLELWKHFIWRELSREFRRTPFSWQRL